MSKYYDGGQLEYGRTALRTTSPAPAIRWLVEKRRIVKGMTVYDFGAGHGRNADFLRDEGCNVYAYDPHNGYNPYKSGDFGWRGVSNMPLTRGKSRHGVDVFLTCFVLNVVPLWAERDIIDMGYDYPQQMHVTRSRDLIKSISDSIAGYRNPVKQWYTQYVVNKSPLGSVADNINGFCDFGVKTTRGFQRDVHLTDDGFDLERLTYGYKIFIK